MKKPTIKISGALLLFLILFLLVWFYIKKNPLGWPTQTPDDAQLQETQDSAARSLLLVSYNVENLFDTQDDPGKNDETFLPIEKKQNASHFESCKKIKNTRWREDCLHLDWSEAALQKKMAALANVLLSVDGGLGTGPDIVLLQEVENTRVLERFNREYLSEAGYKELLLLEGADLRGIDLAILSKLELRGRPQLHELEFSTATQAQRRDTRGVLQADFLLPNSQLLSLFNLHFPAPFHPVGMRRQAVGQLLELVENLPKERLFAAAGDFNIPSDEEKQHGLAAAAQEKGMRILPQELCSTCLGSFYYKPLKQWSFLDMWWWGPGVELLDAGLLKAPTLRTEGNTEIPRSFSTENGEGASDHFPVWVRIAL